MPFKDHLDLTNRWIILAELINWQGFEKTYSQTFSHTGRPGITARKLLGALILKHILCMSDEEITLQITKIPIFNTSSVWKISEVVLPFTIRV